VYRFWDTTHGVHYYTIDDAEANDLIEKYSYIWSYEGVAFYAYPP